MYKIIISFFFFLLSLTAFSQDTLPDVTVTQLGRKVLVSWVNNYPNISNINIQRSGDSLRNFTTIGSVLNVNTRTNGFVDTKEFIPSNQYYRLFISFEGGAYIFTKSHSPAPDTMNIAIDVSGYDQPVQTWFTPSRHVYTGRDHNVIIYLPDAAKKKYSLKFFEDNGDFIFEIKKINQGYLTLDKVNFMHSGLFYFELFDNRVLIERHKVYIPKDGQSIPALDINGNKFRKK